jgi:secondary thiamine-phosphate synthase enzyme
MIRRLTVTPDGKGLHEITHEVGEIIRDSGIREGLCTLMIQHTSASLTIQENGDPSARRDLEAWIERLVPEDDSLYTHNLEGSDDMPAHIMAALTATTLSIPIMDGRPALGLWQGIFIWEHRRHRTARSVVIHIGP